ncbi:MAG: transporter [Rhodospirillales bacterium]|nr:transporter [Rhodospirillales bacterium]
MTTPAGSEAEPDDRQLNSSLSRPDAMMLADERIDAEIESFPPPPIVQPHGKARQILFGGTLVLIAFNLRPLFSSLSAVLPSVVQTTHLSSAGISLMTTLPVLCVGAFAPAAPALARRFGAERSILGLMIVLAIGTALRGLAVIPALAVGTGMAGAAIAIVNVLLPGLIKRDYPHRTGLMSGLYTMALCGGAAAAAGLTVPLQASAGGSWSRALALWAIPALAAALVWAPQAPRLKREARFAGVVISGLYRCPLAWCVTLFMILQSMLSFSVFGWLAPILHARGLPLGTAGVIVSVSVLCQMLACLVAPGIAARARDQRFINAAVMLMAVTGFTGCLFAPLSTIWGWAILQGIGQGALTSVALTLIVLRSSDAHVAAQLSSMVQGVGYGLGAAGPLLVGLLHAWTGGYDAVGAFFLIVGAAGMFAGIGAGRSRHVSARRAPVASESMNLASEPIVAGELR